MIPFARSRPFCSQPFSRSFKTVKNLDIESKTKKMVEILIFERTSSYHSNRWEPRCWTRTYVYLPKEKLLCIMPEAGDNSFGLRKVTYYDFHEREFFNSKIAIDVPYEKDRTAITFKGAKLVNYNRLMENLEFHDIFCEAYTGRTPISEARIRKLWAEHARLTLKE